MSLIVIGEAATSIPEEVQIRYAHIPWSLMRGIRNRIVHAYFAVDDEIMWQTVQDDLPAPAEQLTDLLERTEKLD